MITFNYGPMGSGKSLLAIQTGRDLSNHGPVHFFTGGDRNGDLVISSRLGVSQDCLPRTVEEYLKHARKGVTFIFDEAQFLDPEEIKDIGRLALRGMNIHAFGLLRDYRGSMFRGTRAWMEIADQINLLPMPVSCWCGSPATHHGKIIEGNMSYSGNGVAIGDLSQGSGAVYVTLCRVHWTYGQWQANGVA